MILRRVYRSLSAFQVLTGKRKRESAIGESPISNFPVGVVALFPCITSTHHALLMRVMVHSILITLSKFTLVVLVPSLIAVMHYMLAVAPGTGPSPPGRRGYSPLHRPPYAALVEGLIGPLGIEPGNSCAEAGNVGRCHSGSTGATVNTLF